MKSKENDVKAITEQNFSQLDESTGSVEDNWGKAKETFLDRPILK